VCLARTLGVRAGGCDGSLKDRRELSAFVEQPLELWSRSDFSFYEDDEPMFRFVGLIKDESQPGNEFGPRSSPAGRSVVCRDTRRWTGQLPRDSIRCRIAGKRSNKPQSAHSKSPRAWAQFICLRGQATIEMHEVCRACGALKRW